MDISIGNSAFFESLIGYQTITIKGNEDNPDDNRTVINTIGIKIGISVVLGRTKEQ